MWAKLSITKKSFHADVSNKLATLRKEKEIAQGELAKTVGIHANVLGRYEREEAKPSIDMAAKLADALGVSLDYMIGKTDIEVDMVLRDKILTICKLQLYNHQFFAKYNHHF